MVAVQPRDDNSAVIQVLKPESTQRIAEDGSTTAFSRITIVRIVCDDNAHIDIGTTPAASSSTTYMPQNHVEYFKVNEGESISVTGAGAATPNMFVTTMN